MVSASTLAPVASIVPTRDIRSTHHVHVADLGELEEEVVSPREESWPPVGDDLVV